MTRRPSAGPVRPRNDPEQYDDLQASWWDAGGGFALLHWLARSRAELLPVSDAGGLLVDVACGGGLLAPHVRRLGFRHVGVDLGAGATSTARAHGVTVLRGDARHLPLASACADVVVAGEIFEHVAEPLQVVAEACRVLRPGGTIVCDSVAATRWGRFAAVTVGERVPGGPPPRLHDPALFVDRAELVAAFAAAGVQLRLSGLVPDPLGYLRWLIDPGRSVVLRRIPGTGGLFAGIGVKVAG